MIKKKKKRTAFSGGAFVFWGKIVCYYSLG